jgi:hypothetical protein
MEKYLRYEDVMHAVLHHEGQATVAVVQDLKPAAVIPIDFIKQEIQSYYNKQESIQGFASTLVEISIKTLEKLLRDYNEEGKKGK